MKGWGNCQGVKKELKKLLVNEEAGGVGDDGGNGADKEHFQAGSKPLFSGDEGAEGADGKEGQGGEDDGSVKG